MRCSVWREHAENVAESLTKGMRVIAQGRLRARSYDDQNGNRRTAWELDVDEVGPALRYATAQVTRNQRGGGGNQGGFGGNQGGFGGNTGGGFGGGNQGGGFGGQQNQGGGGDWGAPKQSPANDPWGNSGGSSDWGANPGQSAPPF